MNNALDWLGGELVSGIIGAGVGSAMAYGIAWLRINRHDLYIPDPKVSQDEAATYHTVLTVKNSGKHLERDIVIEIEASVALPDQVRFFASNWETYRLNKTNAVSKLDLGARFNTTYVTAKAEWLEGGEYVEIVLLSDTYILDLHATARSAEVITTYDAPTSRPNMRAENSKTPTENLSAEI